MKPMALVTYKDRCQDLSNCTSPEFRRQPISDYCYQSGTFGAFSGGYLRSPARSFWNITGDYLKGEARHDFWGEATLFVFITITAALPLMNNLHALIQFLRAVISH